MRVWSDELFEENSESTIEASVELESCGSGFEAEPFL